MGNNLEAFEQSKRPLKKAEPEEADRLFLVLTGLLFLAPILVLAVLTLFGG